jgi:1-acyl-sn-glycerol-3-phosphate acyltransferase
VQNGRVWLRRAITIPGYLVLWAVWLAAVPLWLPLAAATDTLRRRQDVALRTGAFVAFYLSCEVAGLAASFGTWLYTRLVRLPDERSAALHHRLEAWWGAGLLRGAMVLFDLHLEVEGAPAAELERGPYLLLVRHTSAADTVLASFLIAHPLKIRLRYVLKRELLWDPCLDVVGNRIPNAFVARGSDDAAGEIRRVQALGRNLGARDAVLIYPEGTRFSAARRARVLEHLRGGPDPALADYAASLHAVLPPRPGGTLGLLDSAATADVVFCAHTGFEGAASIADLWRGELVGRTVHVAFWRVPRSRIPAGRDARIAWLREEWRRVDDWITRRAGPEARPRPLRAAIRS